MSTHPSTGRREDFRSRKERADRARALGLGDDAAKELMTVAGRFVLEAELGRGGQGSVCRAYDLHLERNVALKQLFAADASQAAGLLEEAKTLAQCSHDNLVQVHEAYEDPTDGPLMVMELIEGQSLGQWLHQTDRAWVAVVEIFVQVGRGLLALHERGIVHRDIKPGNVLIADDGRVKLADVGIAVRSPNTTESDSPPTKTHRAGTRFYMAPEHERGGEPTARGDQYSLCVTLHEALYGVRPGQDGGNQRPGPPIPMAIVRVIDRGLQRDPARRFESVAQIVEILDRTLRRRRMLAPTVGGLLVLASGVTALVVLGTDPSPCEREVTAQEQWSGAQRDRVRQAFLSVDSPTNTFSTVDALMTAYTVELDKAHEQACTGLHDGSLERAVAHGSLGCLARAQDMLDTTAAQLRPQTAEQILATPERLWRTLPPLASCQRAPPAVESCNAGQPVPERHAQVAQAIEQRLRAARTSFIRGSYEDGLQRLDEALTMAEPDSLAPLRARVLLAQGRLHYHSDQPQRALTSLGQAQSLAEQNACDGVAAEALTLMAKVSALARAGDPQEGLQWAQQALDKLDRVGDEGLRRADALNSLGLVLHHHLGRYAEADDAYRRAAEIRQRTDERIETPMDLSDTLLNRGAVLAKLGQRAEALAVLQHALEVRSVALGDEHPSLYKIYVNMGNRHREGGDFAAAEGAYRRALELSIAGLGPEHPNVAKRHRALVAALEPQRRFDEAIEHAEKAVEIADKLPDATDLRKVDAWGTLGQVLLSAGKADEARSPLSKANDVVHANPRSTSVEKGFAAMRLGSAELAAGNPAVALEWLDRALAWLESPASVAGWSAYDDRLMAEVQLQRGEAMLALNRSPAAIAAFEQSMAGWEALGSNDERLARVRWGLARALLSSDGATVGSPPWERARELTDQARTFYRAQAGGGAWLSEIDAWFHDNKISFASSDH